MRIIGGKFKGKKLHVPKQLPVRPTTNFAKEGLFNILRNQYDLEEVNVLELFSGSGNITFEFISRGVSSVVAIDNNSKCIAHLKKTSSLLNVDNLTAIKGDVFKITDHFKGQQFTIIYADPPYNLDNIAEIHELVMKNELLSNNGWLIIEHDKHTKLEELPGFVQQRKYGHVNLSIFESIQ